jgi:hypothetical protein
MTTCRDIITRALRLPGLVAAGQQATGIEAEDGLRYLQDMINDLPGLRKGRWTETILTDATAYTAVDGERVNTAGFTPTITLATTYVDDEGRTVSQRDLSRIQIVGGAQAGLWVYSASRAVWSQADALEIGDDHPFGPEDDGGLTALLAVTIADEYGQAGAIAPVTQERAARQLRSFRARFRRVVSAGVDLALLRTSNTGTTGVVFP